MRSGVHLRLSLFLLLAWCVLACLSPHSAWAAATDWRQYKGWKLSDLRVVGMPEHLAGQPDRRLALAGTRKLLRVERPSFQATLLRDDMARLRLFLAQRGYPLARVIPQAEFLAQDRSLALTLEVQPGPPVRVGPITYTGWPLVAPSPESDDGFPLVQGKTFRDEDMKAARSSLRRLLQDAGFATPELEYEIRVLADSLRVGVHWTVRSGPFAMVDSLAVEGCGEGLVPLVRRVGDFQPGRPYAQSRLQAMASDLRRTQLFRRIDLETEELTPGHLLLRARLEEARLRTWSAAVGTWSDNPWQVEVGWTHRNLFGHGVGFDSRAALASHFTRAGGGVFWLGWLERQARTRVGLDYVEEDEEAYLSREGRLDLVQVFRPGLRDALKLGVTASHVDVEIHNLARGVLEVNPGRLLELWLDWKWDRTDDPIMPGHGYYTKLSTTWAVPFGVSAAPYTAAQLDAAWFRSLPGDWLLAVRGRLGLAKPLADAADLLPNRRFFAGGFNTMRGQKRRELGPLDAEGNPRGGQATMLAGLELRRPLWKLLHGAAFLDGGQVWRSYQDLAVADLVWAVGVSLDVVTPVGPLRVNHAWNLDLGRDCRPARLWSAGIGYPW